MKLFNASHVELKRDFTENFATNPHEGGWADECIFFISVEGLQGKDAALEAAVQISHDGVNWVDEGTKSTAITTLGLHFVRVKHFGNWLRLNCTVSGEQPVFRLNIQIALKG